MKRIVLLLSSALLICQVAQAAGSVRLTTPVSGMVREVHAEVGQRVKKGDKLLVLDDVRFQAKVMEAEAGVMRARQEAEEADKDLKRAEELYARGVSATTELDAARLRQVRGAASLKEAEARLMLARKNLEDTVLKAPFDGVIRSREAEPGMVVPAEFNPPVLFILERSR